MNCESINPLESLSVSARQSFRSIIDIAMVEAITSYEEFRQFINSEELAIVDFYADWCGACQRISPVFETLSKKFGTIKFRKVNAEEQKQLSQELGIRVFPTFVVFQKGEIIRLKAGPNPIELQTLVQNASSLVA
ncbi:thioredoxin-like protein [Pisolithus croceorrhizus]|nr:thioredoxin-like protein [Pisolithus croceorrhizus]